MQQLKRSLKEKKMIKLKLFNRPFIYEFQKLLPLNEGKSKTFLSCYLNGNKNHFHMKGSAISLTLKQGLEQLGNDLLEEILPDMRVVWTV